MDTAHCDRDIDKQSLLLSGGRHLCWGLVLGGSHVVCEALIEVVEDGRELLSLGLRHVLAQQLVSSRLVLAYPFDVGIHTNLL